MKKIISYIADFLKDKNDGSSHKRLLAVASFTIATIIAFTTSNVAMAGLFLAGAGWESGATLFEKKDV